MATLQQRIDSLGIALFNRTAPQAQLDRMVTAIAARRQINLSTLTQAQQAQLLLDFGHEAYVGVLRQFEGQQASTVAESTKAAEVNSEFTPT